MQDLSEKTITRYLKSILINLKHRLLTYQDSFGSTERNDNTYSAHGLISPLKVN